VPFPLPVIPARSGQSVGKPELSRRKLPANSVILSEILVTNDNAHVLQMRGRAIDLEHNFLGWGRRPVSPCCWRGPHNFAFQEDGDQLFGPRRLWMPVIGEGHTKCVKRADVTAEETLVFLRFIGQTKGLGTVFWEMRILALK
jgi:hypothetical protein